MGLACDDQAGKIYLIIFNWPADGKFVVPGLESRVKKVYLLEDGKKVGFHQNEQGVTLSLPEAGPDKIASVICLNIAEKKARVAEQKQP